MIIGTEPDLSFNIRLAKSNDGNFEDFYTLKAKISSNFFCDIWGCVHNENNALRLVRVYAKMYIDKMCDDTSLFLDEIGVLKRLNHTSVIRVYDFFEDGNNYYIVTEMFTGTALGKRVTELGRCSELEISNIIKQIL